jgi:hypothetical protein
MVRNIRCCCVDAFSPSSSSTNELCFAHVGRSSLSTFPSTSTLFLITRIFGFFSETYSLPLCSKQPLPVRSPRAHPPSFTLLASTALPLFLITRVQPLIPSLVPSNSTVSTTYKDHVIASCSTVSVSTQMSLR